MPRIKLGVSSCLLGEEVRFDGGHKYDSWIVDTLGQFAEYIPICPEVGCGLAIPREAMHLVGNKDDYRMLTIKTGIDHTERMLSFCKPTIAALKQERLCGYIFKSKSPSCGLEQVKVYPPYQGVPGKTGIGIYAREFMHEFPLLPVEEEGRLHDAERRENFITRIFIMQRWQQMIDGKVKASDLVRFHTIHKYLIMAHSPQHYREMGKLVAALQKEPLSELLTHYFELLMTACKRHATPRKQQYVLLHILGYFKQDLDAFEKQEMMEILSQYKEGLIPLIVPITLLNHYVRKYDKSYLADQIYLHPHPIELKLLNHA